MKKKQSAPAKAKKSSVKRVATPKTPQGFHAHKNTFFKAHPNARPLLWAFALSVALFVYIFVKVQTEIKISQEMYQQGYTYQITLFPSLSKR